MGEQHHLLKAELLQLVQPIDDGLWCTDEPAVVQTEPGPAEPPFGNLPRRRQRCGIGRKGHHGFDRQHNGRRIAADGITVRPQHRQLVFKLA